MLPRTHTFLTYPKIKGIQISKQIIKYVGVTKPRAVSVMIIRKVYRRMFDTDSVNKGVLHIHSEWEDCKC